MKLFEKKMRDIFKLFERRYSAVNTNETSFPLADNNNTTEENLQYLQKIDFNHQQRKKSLQPSRSIKRGFTIVDSFFAPRKGGRRYPKCKLYIVYIQFKLNKRAFQICIFIYLFLTVVFCFFFLFRIGILLF